MLTVLQAIQKTTDYLAQKGIDSPRANAEILLADILRCKRLNLYLMFDRPLTKDETEKYREYLKRRSKFEPLQYITGTVDFFGMQFRVTPSVLIPRPETEILVETIINSVDVKNKINILDIGSGSGNISIALAKNIEHSFVTGVEISKEAIDVALSNLKMHSLEDKVKFINADILNDDLSKAGKFEVIVSNPPYISGSEFENVQKEIKDFEPQIAVTDFGDGFLFYRVISKLAYKLLNPGGKLFFELGIHQSEKVKDILSQNNFTDIIIVKDYQDIDRVIYGIKK